MNSAMTTEQRLNKVKLALRKATEEALQGSANEDVLTMQQQENRDPNQSFALGMTLFGQDAKVVERQIQDKLNEIEQELVSLVVATESQNSPSDAGETPCCVPSSPEALALEVHGLKARIAFLRQASLAKTALDQAAALSSTEAAAMLVQAKLALELAQDIVAKEEAQQQQTEAPSPALQGAYRILDSINTTLRRKRIELVYKAKQLLETTMELTESTLTVRGDGEALDILQALSEAVDALEPTIITITDQLLQTILEPLLTSLQHGAFVTMVLNERAESSTLTNGKGTKFILEWSKEKSNSKVATDRDEEYIHQWKSIVQFYSRVLVFVQKHVLLERQSLCRIMGQRLFGRSGPVVHGLDLKNLGLESHLLDESGRLMKPMIDLLWNTCIPVYIEPDAFGNLQDKGKSLRSLLLPFEEELVTLGFAESDTPLNDFSNNFEQKYMEKRRLHILNEVRNILVQNDYHNTSQVGEDVSKPDKDSIIPESTPDLSIFKLHKSAVSDTAQKVMELVRRTMDEAVAHYSESMLSAVLYRTSRDMLDLFRAIIPSTHAAEIKSLPRTAAVLHNDCVFLAHHCLTLGLEYKERFPETTDERGRLLREACIFVDMVPPFRELADKAMGDMLEGQRDQLWELVGVRVTLLGRALESNESLMEWTDAETAMKAGLHHLQHLSHAWKPILSTDVFCTSIGFLVDFVFGMFLEQILSATDISESACSFLSSLTSIAMQSVLRMVPTTKDWDRFSAVGRFMDMSLVDVHVALSQGVFASVTGPELSKLIRATFGDSEKRRMLLKALEQPN